MSISEDLISSSNSSIFGRLKWSPLILVVVGSVRLRNHRQRRAEQLKRWRIGSSYFWRLAIENEPYIRERKMAEYISITMPHSNKCVSTFLGALDIVNHSRFHPRVFQIRLVNSCCNFAIRFWAAGWKAGPSSMDKCVAYEDDTSISIGRRVRGGQSRFLPLEPSIS